MKIKIFYFILTGIVLYLLQSCSSATKLYNKAKYKDMPTVAKLARLDWPCIVVDSTIETNYKPSFDSSNFYKTKVDSLTKVKKSYRDSIAIRYKDTCKSVQDNFNNGFDIGYKAGVYEGKKVARIDTLYQTKTLKIKDSADIYLLNDENVKLKSENKKLQKKIVFKNKFLWLLLALLFITSFISIYAKR